MDTSTPYSLLDAKNAVTQSPMWCYPDPVKRYTVYTETSDGACGTQLSQECDGTEFPKAFPSNTFTDTQRKWSTTEQEAYRVHYAVMKWNYSRESKSFFVTTTNHWWGFWMERMPITKWTDGDWNWQPAILPLSGYQENKAADCLSRLVKLPHDRQATIQMLTTTDYDGPAFNTRSRTAQQTITEHLTPQPNADAVTPDVTTVKDTPDVLPKPLTEDRINTLLQMDRMDPFCKCISKCLSNGKAPKHEADLFLHVKGLLYKHVSDSNQKFLALVILKAWKYTVLMEAHNKLIHQGATHTYCLIKWQHY